MKLKLFFADDQIDKYNILGWLQILILGALLFLLVYSLQFWQAPWHVAAVVRILGVAVLSSAGFLLVGFVLGFIFCIPRTAAAKSTADASAHAPTPGATMTAADADAAKSTATASIETNSNLVEISDWLTKILVGVGLVELNTIPQKILKLTAFLGGGLRNCTEAASDACVHNSEALALGIVVFFFAAGFLFGYIWTRFYFQVALAELAKGAERVDKSWINTSITWAELLLEKKDLDGANAFIDHWLKAYGSNPAALLIKGRILKRKALREDGTVDADTLRTALMFVSRSADLKPDKAEPVYNIACYQALLGMDKSEVLKNLAASIRLEPRFKYIARVDSDFASLREDSDFKSLTA